jgi:hypothetical protein
MAAGSASKKTARGAASANDVDDFMRSLDHPLKAELQAVRNIIRGVEPGITEGIKWNAPSFCLRDHFATFNIRADVLLVILHQGAKSTAASANGVTIDDPGGLLEWRGKDRAVVTFSDMKAIKARKAAFEHILRQWIAALP